MKSLIRTAAIALALLAAQFSFAQTVIRVAPPAPPHVVVGRAPGPNYVWTAGYYRWHGGRYVWVPGRWLIPPRPGVVWVPAHWVARGGGWVFVSGHWR